MKMTLYSPEPVTHCEKVCETLAAQGSVKMTKWGSKFVAVVMYRTVIQKIQKVLMLSSTDYRQNENMKFKIVSKNFGALEGHGSPRFPKIFPTS